MDPQLFALYLLITLSFGATYVQGHVLSRVKRIAGGEDAKETEFPYQLSLRYEGLHICGGTLISETHVLTAAHCICGIIDEPYEDLTVVSGTVKINKGGQTHMVRSVRCHPHFEYGLEHSWENDIAVLTLNQSITFNATQLPVNLPKSDTVKCPFGVITGWGRSDENGFLHKNLQKLSVHILTNDQCQSYYNNSILPSQICTFNGRGSGACKGDSGSPLVSNGTILGIFSWTKPCARGSPDVFTKVYYFMDFIKSSMTNDPRRNTIAQDSTEV